MSEHENKQDDNVPQEQQQQHVEGAGAETKDCVFWMRGECLKGDACPFRHDPAKHGTAPAHGHHSTPSAGTHAPPCKYFLAGHCDKGDACPFSHYVCSALFLSLFFLHTSLFTFSHLLN